MISSVISSDADGAVEAPGTADGASGTADGASVTADGASGTADGASGTADGASGAACIGAIELFGTSAANGFSDGSTFGVEFSKIQYKNVFEINLYILLLNFKYLVQHWRDFRLRELLS